MLLDRIEIDSHGPLHRVELGPFSHHLNVILGANGSGKTAISRFIRDSLIDREYPRGMLSDSSGRIVWVTENGHIHCRREQDGTHTGRRRVEFEPRSEAPAGLEGYANGWFDDREHLANPHSGFAGRVLQNIRIPESIVDGVMVDTTLCSAARVVAACLSAGLDREDWGDRRYALEYENETSYAARHFTGSVGLASADQVAEHRRLRTQLADIEAEIANLRGRLQATRSVSSPTYVSVDTSGERARCLQRRDELIRRRDVLLRRLSVVPTVAVDKPDYSYAHVAAADETRLRELHRRADSLRAHAASLQCWITDIDRLDQQVAPTLQSAAVYGSHASLSSAWQTTSFQQLQNQVERADDEIVTLRRILAEVHHIGQLTATTPHSFGAPPTSSRSPWDHEWLASQRYYHFIHAIDRYQPHWASSDFYNRAYQPLRPLDDVALRLESCRSQIQALIARRAHITSWASDIAYVDRCYQTLTTIDRMLADAKAWVPDRLRQVASELSSTIEHLLADRGQMIDALAASRRQWFTDATRSPSRTFDWRTQRGAAEHELREVENELRSVLAETASLRRAARFLPVVDSSYSFGLAAESTQQQERLRADRILNEVRGIDEELAVLGDRLVQLGRYVSSNVHDGSVAPSRELQLEIDRLIARREEITRLLHRLRPTRRQGTNLAEIASRWLVRLTGGRHHQIRWTTQNGTYDALSGIQRRPGTGEVAAATGSSVTVHIDNREESMLPAASRAIAAMAVRMAAGEVLNRIGKSVPLVIETQTELFDAIVGMHERRSIDDPAWRAHVENGYRQFSRDGGLSDVVSSALADYAAEGRQLLLLTESSALADSLQRSGGRLFRLHSEKIVHAHRPVFQSGYRHDQYVGPHAEHSPARDYTLEGVNVQFNQAWRETAGIVDDIDYLRHASEYAPAGTPMRDGYYAGNRTTTRPTAESNSAHYYAAADNGYGSETILPVSPRVSVAEINNAAYVAPEAVSSVRQDAATVRTDGAMVGDSLIARRAADSSNHESTEVPFFLSVDSPIDAAPSIDSVAAARLRRIGISHITHLMNQDSNRLADTLGLAGVDAKTIRRWQAECRLMCRVQQLRGFDARVLVGCGITTPEGLAAIHPTDLLDRVKTFLATEHGQRILLSGTSYELSRITSWIASANQSVLRRRTHRRTVDGRASRRRVIRDQDSGYRNVSAPAARYEYVDIDDSTTAAGSMRVVGRDDLEDDFDRDRYEIDVVDRADRLVDEIEGLTQSVDRQSRSRSTSRSQSRRSGSSRASSTARSSRGERDSYGRDSERQRRSSRGRTQRSERRRSGSSYSESSRSNRGNRNTLYSTSERSDSKRSRSSRQERESRSQAELHRSDERELRFYLHRADDVVDAPSIGPRMAARLYEIGINTVDDLLQADAADVATQLDHRRVDEETVLQWQQQTTLVCRVPMMRGHDAQFLVAAEVTTAEQLAECDPETLFASVDAIANSSEGKRIARGGTLPDLEEVTEWIGYAAHHRSLQAA